MSQTYTVQSGDTLGGIAQRYGVDVKQLAQQNGIHDENRIAVGQTLTIPEDDATDSNNVWAQTLLRFVDALERPIAGLGVRLVAGEREVAGTTNGSGMAPLFLSSEPNRPIEIYAQKHPVRGGGEKHIASYIPMAGKQTVKLQSGMHVHKVGLRTHAGTPAKSPQSMSNQKPGTRVETRDLGGHPVTCIVGSECPNTDNLKLGINNVYRDWVKQAAARAGLIPQTVAAVMNAEAAKTKDLQWKADSRSSKSSATGMAQFLDSTGIDMALLSGTYLNSKAIAEGWLSNDANGHLEFKKADGSAVQADKHYGLGRKLAGMVKPRRTTQDDNLQKLLDLRCTPEYAIMTAMDYAKMNLDALRQKGYTIDGLNDEERARIMYLCHHLGTGDVVNFIQNTIMEARAQKLLNAQIEHGRANQYFDENGNSWVKGHRAWLQDFIGAHLALSAYTCPGDKLDSFQDDEQLAVLLKATDKLKR